MVYYLPFIGAIALASGFMFEKVVLRRRKVDIKLYQTASFLAIILVMLPFLYFFWKLEAQAFTGMNLFIFALVVLFSMIANMFTFYSMKWEKVSNLEPAKMLEPLFTILLAIIFSFFAVGLYDRNMNVIVPALIAGLALIFSHLKKHHIDFNKYFIAAIFGAFFFALELVTTRLILNYYSPLTFYFARCSAIFLLSLIIFRPDFKKLGKKSSLYVLITGAIWVIYRTIVYYGYLNLGVIFTTLIIMLGPVFVYLFARIFLKEKIEPRNIIASAVIVVCVLYALLV
jgi:drug/metabolite transporter (DMT)-like permease